MKLLIASAFLLFSGFPLENPRASAQQNTELSFLVESSISFNRLIINKIKSSESREEGLNEKELKFEPLTMVEMNMARNLNSHWVWPEYTLEMIDSYSPFLFRTKKSQELEEVTIMLNVNSKGRISGFEVLGEVDKGTKERLDHMIRKMPVCKPVPGFESYTPSIFELTIKK
ncbi:hypothetical protein [Algoriphagus mannitolivorans]|uniref:hypothetical protein n=1 Tax=Algoriphagus mannitolivorans TaxID=226504 RepID=UPI000411A2B8|nr:hypothetical protein [Algoriphagus mannitolivorans]